MTNPRARTKSLIVQATGDELIVFDQDRNLSYALNPTTALVYKHADGTRSVRDLVAVLQAELGETVDEDLVQMTLDKLHRARLLDTSADRSAEMMRATRRRFVRKVGLVGALTLLLPVVETAVAPTSAMAQSGDSCDSDSDSGCVSESASNLCACPCLSDFCNSGSDFCASA